MTTQDIIVGIAIDVSGSMKEPLASFDEESKSEGIVSVSKLREILNVISRHLQDRGAGEISSKYLGIAFGLNSTENAVYGDLLHMMHYTTKRIQISRQLLLEQYGSDLSPPRCLTLLIERLVNAGAPSVESYARKYLSPGIAKFILPFLAGPNGERLLRDIVERLPVSCKNGFIDAAYGGTKNVLWLTSIFVGPAVGSWSASVDRNEHESAQEIIKYATSRVDDLCQPHLPDDIKSKPFVSTDINIVDSAVMREILDEWELLLGDNRSDQDADPTGLLNSRLYGMTPMHKALQIMFNRFNNLPQSADSAQTRILFLVSDGVPTDATPDAVREIATQLKNIGVTIVSCYLSTNPRIPAKELFYSRQDNWDDGAKLMFDISSPMKNTAPGLKVLIDQGWKLPLQGIHNLFFQGNNRENLETFVKFTREIRNSDRHGCLLDVITRVDLDLIITNHMSQFEPRRQVGGTCYAHAIAAVFFLAMKRIKFRENGHPEFADIKNYLITKYGENGANTRSVLEASGVVYRLKFREVDEIGARQAINCRRPVVARFRLYDSQWTKFSQFYARNPTGILTSNDIIRTTNDPNESNGGHAVVLIDIHPDHLTFLNSWGTTFADQGFFHVQDSNVLKMEFFDVYWTLNELTQLEKDEYHRSISTGA